jgi:hypothetical protein
MPETRRERDAVLEARFERFWAAYPRKDAKFRALAVWRWLAPSEDLLGRMLRTLEWQRRDRQWLEDGGYWVPYARAWLAGRRWEDEPFEPQSAMARRSPGPQTRTQRVEARNQETLRRFLARERGEEP